MRVPYPRSSAGRLRRMSLGVAPTSGTCAYFIKVTFEVAMQCRRATERMLVCEEATVQRICDGDVRVYANNLASAHHVGGRQRAGTYQVVRGNTSEYKWDRQ